MKTVHFDNIIDEILHQIFSYIKQFLILGLTYRIPSDSLPVEHHFRIWLWIQTGIIVLNLRKWGRSIISATLGLFNTPLSSYICHYNYLISILRLVKADNAAFLVCIRPNFFAHSFSIYMLLILIIWLFALIIIISTRLLTSLNFYNI